MVRDTHTHTHAHVRTLRTKRKKAEVRIFECKEDLDVTRPFGGPHSLTHSLPWVGPLGPSKKGMGEEVILSENELAGINYYYDDLSLRERRSSRSTLPTTGRVFLQQAHRGH